MNMKAISTRLRATNVFMSAMLRYLQFIGNGWYFWTIKYKHIYVRLIIPGCCPDFITWLYNSSHEPKPILPWYPSSEIGQNGYHLDMPGSLIWIGHCWRLWSSKLFLFLIIELQIFFLSLFNWTNRLIFLGAVASSNIGEMQYHRFAIWPT